MPEIRFDPESNVIELGDTAWEAVFDRIIVLQDDFRSGLECPRCMGRDVRNEISVVVCENCAGSGKSSIVKDGKCSICSGAGVVPCPDCKGKGGTIILPEEAQRRPTTGTIYSVGDRVLKFKRGDRVIFPSFVGHAFDLSATDIHGNPVLAVITVMRDEEVLCKIHGTLELKQLRKSIAIGTLA